MSSERAAFATYRAELAQRPALSPEEERELAIRFREGDRAAGRRLVEACLPFVMSIALEYRRWGVPLEDIVQEGNVGLLKAVARFDPDKGCRLATYAAFWIRAEIREHVVRAYRIVRLGTTKRERRVLRLYRKTRERDPAVLARESGLCEERVVELLPLLVARDASLDAPLPSGMLPLELLASPARTPEEEACANDERARLSDALERILKDLSVRERRIVRKRWLAESPMTLEQLGAAFGVSKERVRQLEERAKSRVRARFEELAIVA